MSIFTKVKMAAVRSSSFNLNHDKKLSFDMGELIPTCVMDVLPGDKFTINVETMLRFAPLISPVMHKIMVKTNYFFVPNRILWDNWEKWITGEYEVAPPQINTQFSSQYYTPGTLGDYLGYPEGGANNGSLGMNAFPIAAYFKIYDDYYRDENLQTEVWQTLIDDNNNIYYTELAAGKPKQRAWMHDYFTSCLPFPQKGDAASIPLLSQEVILDTNYPINPQQQRQALDGTLSQGNVEGDDGTFGSTGDQVTGNGLSVTDPNGTLRTDQAGNPTSIESLRKAFRLQEWLEKNARGGTRYIEFIKSHFSVFSSDKRLQRPEYIGGYTQNMIISEVLSTAQDTAAGQEIPLATMGGHGISVGSSAPFKYTAEEHGWIIGIMSVTPVTAYQQGLTKMFNRKSYLDYYFPSFANLGEQEVLNSELYYANELPANLDKVFGYIPRYAEYKYMSSTVHGDFKDTLNYWHLGREFTSAPALTSDFITVDQSNLRRIFAVIDPDVNTIYGHIFNNITARRKMPKYAVPTI